MLSSIFSSHPSQGEEKINFPTHLGGCSAPPEKQNKRREPWAPEPLPPICTFAFFSLTIVFLAVGSLARFKFFGTGTLWINYIQRKFYFNAHATPPPLNWMHLYLSVSYTCPDLENFTNAHGILISLADWAILFSCKAQCKKQRIHLLLITASRLIVLEGKGARNIMKGGHYKWFEFLLQIIVCKLHQHLNSEWETFTLTHTTSGLHRYTRIKSGFYSWDKRRGQQCKGNQSILYILKNTTETKRKWLRMIISARSWHHRLWGFNTLMRISLVLGLIRQICYD